MGSVTVRLNEHDRRRLCNEVADTVLSRFLERFRPVLDQVEADAKVGKGIRVLSSADVREQLGASQYQLDRLERSGQFPRRRQISSRRVGYFSHEIDGLPAEAVLAHPRRSLTLEELSAKIGLDRSTVSRMTKKRELPSKVDGKWIEREIDEWLLSRPRV